MKRIVSLMMIICFSMITMIAQESGYKFTDVKTLAATPVKDQHRSGTCWSFSGISFFESELMRMGKGEFDLSEMYVVRNTYSEKAKQYVRMHGNVNFAAGGAFNDVTMVIKDFGIVPENDYQGMEYGEDSHVHGEVDMVLKSYIDGVIKNRNRKLSTAWLDGFEGLLDAYFGILPEYIRYEENNFTPNEFAGHLGLNMSNYVMVSSFTHHPFYEPFILEVPDNWAWGEVYNVKIDEMTEIIDHSIDEGYTVAWATDVSEKGFNWSKGLAVVPDDDIEELEGLERSRWEEMTDEEKQALIYDFSTPRKEKEITQEMRQQAFDNYQTTDDHGMHITGIAEDQNGSMYYLVKNSWNTDKNPYNGYLYASKAFVKYKSTSLLVHKDGIPEGLKKKLGL